MKKIILSLFTLTSIAASAQTVLNPGFETWVSNTETAHTYQVPQHWVTTDVLNTYVNEIFGNPGYVVNAVSQTAGHSGNYAVQMAVAASNMGDTAAGGVFYCDDAATIIDQAFGGTGTPGFQFSSRPANMTVWYKWNRVGGDTAVVSLQMSKWNTTTQMRDYIALESVNITNPAASWTQLTIPITYSLSMNPDTIFVFAGNNSDVPHIGSVFTIDDIAFSGSVGISENTVAQTTVAVMPNPFTQQATLNIPDAQLSNGTFEMFDVLGNKVKSIGNLSGSSFIIDREGLTAGMYFYTITGDNGFVATGKLTVE